MAECEFPRCLRCSKLLHFLLSSEFPVDGGKPCFIVRAELCLNVGLLTLVSCAACSPACFCGVPSRLHRVDGRCHLCDEPSAVLDIARPCRSRHGRVGGDAVTRRRLLRCRLETRNLCLHLCDASGLRRVNRLSLGMC